MSNLSKNLLKASFIGTFAETMFAPLYAIFMGKVGGSILDVGIGYSIFSIVTGVIVIILGRTKWFSNHIYSMVFWGFGIAGVGDLLYILVSSWMGLFVVQAVVGIATGVLSPAWDSLYTDDGENDSAKRWSFWGGGLSFVQGVAAIVGSIILASFGFNALFISMALIDVVCMFYAFRVWKERPTT